jgi:glycosidase
VPEHQKWVNNALFDGGGLSTEQKELRGFYSDLLNTVKNNEALRTGEFYELMIANEHQPGFDTKLYIYLRYTDTQRVLVLVNFNRTEKNIRVNIPADLLTQFNLNGNANFTDLLTKTVFKTDDIASGIDLNIKSTSGLLLNF